MAKLGDAYYGRNITVVNQRLAIAAVRLAVVLAIVLRTTSIKPLVSHPPYRPV